jgi:predicted dienelactone hydrolase
MRLITWALTMLSSLALPLPNTISHPTNDHIPRQRPVASFRTEPAEDPHLPATSNDKHRAFLVGTATVELSVPSPLGQGEPLELRTEIWYPATERAEKLVPDLAGAPYPLIVFSQGFDLAVSAYSSLLGQWAAAGFMVAAPTYPFTSPPAPLDEADILNHPAELRSVIAALTNGSRHTGSSLSGLVDKREIGIAGQSDGGDVSLAAAYNTCCYDPAVKAVAVLSGAELSSFGGAYFTGPQVPLLVAQGTSDIVNPPGCSAQLYDNARGPKWYLDLPGAGHLAPYSGIDAPQTGPLALKDAAYRRVVAEVTTDFFEAELSATPPAKLSTTRWLAAAGDIPSLADLTSGPRAPIAAGYCPGAPA